MLAPTPERAFCPPSKRAEGTGSETLKQGFFFFFYQEGFNGKAMVLFSGDLQEFCMINSGYAIEYAWKIKDLKMDKMRDL